MHAISEKFKPGGLSYSPDTWHLYCRQRWLGASDIVLPNGETITEPNHTSTLDVAEFNELMTAVEAWAAERGVWLDEAWEAA